MEMQHLLAVGDGPDKRPRTKRVTRKAARWELLKYNILWRAACAVSFSVLLLVVVLIFSNIRHMSNDQKRIFNALNLTCSALVSMSLGSLMELMGKTARWRLLMHHNTPSDVDLILEAPKPTGSFALLWRHFVVNRKRTAVTWWVAGYLFVNIAMRLSVSLVGFAYNVNETPTSEYPASVTNWLAEDRGIRVPDDLSNGLAWEALAENMDSMTNWATIGLFIAPTGLQGGDQSLSGPSVPEGLSREVADDRVEYTYSLGEFRGRNVTTQLRGSLKSESTCTGWAILNNTVHIGGVENGTFTEDFELIYEPLRRFGPNVRQDTVIWTAPTDGNNFRNPSSCLTTYLISVGHVNGTDGKQQLCAECLDGFVYECSTCLSGLERDSNFGDGYIPPNYLPYFAQSLLLLGSYTDNFPADRFTAKRHIAGLQSPFAFEMPPSFFNCNSDRGTTVPPEAELQVSNFVARVPALALAGGEQRLERVQLNKEETIINTVRIDLEVRWDMAIGVLAGVLFAQLAVVVFTLGWTRNALLRDNLGILSVARLMKTMTERMGGSSTASSEELAEQWHEAMVVYGTRRVDGTYEADLWTDVVPEFPDGEYR